MKVLLIRPPEFFQSLDITQGPRVGLPLGLMYVAACLRKAKPDARIRIFDALVEFPLDVRRNRIGEDGFIHFGKSYEEISQIVADFQPDLVGISNQYTDFLNQALQTARAVKAANSSIPVVLGGNSVTSNPNLVLKSHSVDLVVMGEGELTLIDIFEGINSGRDLTNVSGLAHKANGKMIINPPRPFISKLDTLPLPAYDLVDLERYFWMEKLGFSPRHKFEYPGAERSVSVITSRGCPYQCIFCSVGNHMGKEYRSHSAEYVLHHLEFLKKRYDVRHIHFEDDNLTLNGKRVHKILDGMVDRQLRLTWDTPNGIRADTLNQGLIHKMIRSGATYVIVGIESGSQEVNRNIIKKNLNLKVSEKNMAIASKEGLDIHAFYLIGLPGETRKQIQTTIDFAKRMKRQYNVQPHMAIANPIRNTEMYRIAQQAGWLVEEPNREIRFHFGIERRFSRPAIKTPEFDITYLNDVMKKFNRAIIPISCKKAVLFLAKHPVTLWYLGIYLLHLLLVKKLSLLDAMKALFYKKLFYPHFFLRFRSKVNVRYY